MNKVKRMLIILISLLVILLIVLLILKEKTINEKRDIVKDYTIQEINYSEVSNPVMYFTVKNCLDRYINYLSEYNVQVLYNLLDDNYKQKYEITLDNLQDNIKKIDNNVVTDIEKMYVEEKDDIHIYYIHAQIFKELYGENNSERNNKKKDDIYITIILDINNMTYSIIPNGGGVFNEQIQ